MKIAFSGKMGVGKDTAVEYLYTKYEGEHISFSQPIYEIQVYAQKICGFPIQKDRKFLQWIGTEWARNIDPNVWINIALKKTPCNGNAYISDVRFRDEYDALKKNGWICIKITRDNKEDNKGSGSVYHSSETDLDDFYKWDYIIENNGSVDDLFDQLDKIVVIINEK